MSQRKKSDRNKQQNKDIDNLKLNINKICLCGKCNDKVLDNVEQKEDESIECDGCRQWFHNRCSELTFSQWNTVTSSCESIVWKCITCCRNKGNEAKKIHNLEERIDLLLQMVSNLEDNLMTRIEEKITKNLEEKQDIKLKEMEAKITSKIQETIEEKEEQERRMNNIVVVNLAESKKSKPNERAEDDLLAIKEVLGNTIEIETEDLCEPIRLGKKTESSKPRPLKITVKSTALKKRILQNFRTINDNNNIKDPQKKSLF